MRLPPVCAGGTTEDTVDVISSFLINTEYVNAGLVFGNDLQCNLAKESGQKKKKRKWSKKFFSCQSKDFEPISNLVLADKLN